MWVSCHVGTFGSVEMGEREWMRMGRMGLRTCEEEGTFGSAEVGEGEGLPGMRLDMKMFI